MPKNTIPSELIIKFENINSLIKEHKKDEAKAALLSLSMPERPLYVEWAKERATTQLVRQQELSNRMNELKSRQERLVAERDAVMKGYAKKFAKG